MTAFLITRTFTIQSLAQLVFVTFEEKRPLDCFENKSGAHLEKGVFTLNFLFCNARTVLIKLQCCSAEVLQCCCASHTFDRIAKCVFAEDIILVIGFESWSSKMWVALADAT